jgi:hypothetical protein
MRAAPALGAALAMAAQTSVSAAQDSGGDGAYGRLQGDLGLQMDVGGAMAGRNPAATVAIAARYLQTAGLYATYLDDFQQGSSSASRSGSLGVELRPLFLIRFTSDVESGPAVTDLLIDSLSLRLGAVVGKAHGYDWLAPGLETGLGWGLPLSGSCCGPWLDASVMLRISHAQMTHESALASDRFVLFSLTLGWQSLFNTHLVDAGDRLQR